MSPWTPSTSPVRTCDNSYYCNFSFESNILSSWEKKYILSHSLWDSNYLEMVQCRKWSQACWEWQIWAACSAEIPPENQYWEKSAFLLTDSPPPLFFMVDILPPGYPLHSHLIASCKAMVGLIFQTMWDDVQNLTRNQQLRLEPWPAEWKYSLWQGIS